MAVVENYTTKIAATKTASEIQELLAVHGVTRIMLEYADGRPSGVMFEAATEFGLKPFRLPVDVDAMHQTAESREAGRAPAQDREHAERVAWRVVAEWLRAQMTLIASRMVTLDQVMLPYLVVDNGQSLYGAWREQGLLELTDGADHG